MFRTKALGWARVPLFVALIREGGERDNGGVDFVPPRIARVQPRALLCARRLSATGMEARLLIGRARVDGKDAPNGQIR